MRKYRNWILSLGIIAAPGLAVAEPSPFGNEPQSAPRPADGQANNQEVAENIARTLRSAKLPGSNIDITVSGGVAKLSGQIADSHSKALASQLVSNVPGVKQVDNLLQVPLAPPVQGGVKQAAFDSPFGNTASHIQQVAHAQPAAPPAPSAPSNQVMAERIGAALSSAQLSGYQIKIGFAQGNAVLLGSVGTPQQRIVAEQVARSVPGVKGVDNRLQVQAAAPNPQMLQQAAYQETDPGMPPVGPPAVAPGPGVVFPGPGFPGGPAPVYNNMVPGANPILYNQPYLPQYSWPAQAQYPNSAAIQYPKQYAASAWPYIGPFYPYPQVPLGWRKATLEWDDGHWMLDFDSKTDKWFWFLNPKNW